MLNAVTEWPFSSVTVLTGRGDQDTVTQRDAREDVGRSLQARGEPALLTP